MNLARDALRLAVMETLQPGGPDGTAFPTLAGPFVYDSDFGPAEMTAAVQRRPIIAVYTDDDHQTGEADVLDPANALREVMLAFEIMVPAALDDGSLSLGSTDHEIELKLGLLGSQIEAAIHLSRQSGPLRHVLVSVNEITTRGWRDADSDTRLAAKRIEMLCRIRCSDLLPGTGAGLARLPQPLRGVAQDIDPATPRGAMLATLSDLLAAPDPLPLLAELSLAAKTTGAAGPALTPVLSGPPPQNPVAQGAVLHGRIALD